MSTIVMVLTTWTGVSLPVSLAAGRLLRRASSDYALVPALPTASEAHP